MKGVYAIVSSLAIWASGSYVFAQLEENQFLVYLMSDDPFVIQQAKAIAPDAFAGSLDSGRKVLQLGRYTNLNLAQKRSDELKGMGLPIDIAKVSNKKTISQPIGTDPIPTPGSFNPSPSTVVSTVPITSSRPELAPLPGVPGSPEFSNSSQSIEISRPPSNPGVPTTEIIPSSSSNPVSTQELQSFARRNRYLVIIPSTSQEVLTRVKEISPAAKLSASERGSFIEIQGYPERSSAESFNRSLRDRGFDSRVIFL